MMGLRLGLLLVLFVVAAGCDALPSTRPAGSDSRFGNVPIIRSGMAKRDVDRLLGSSFPGESLGGTITIHSYYGTELDIHFNGSDKVTSIYPRSVFFSGGTERGTFTDSDLRRILRHEMTSQEVDEQIGSPVCGYELRPGTIVMIHHQPGIAIVYVNGLLTRWGRTHSYSDSDSVEDPTQQEKDDRGAFIATISR